MVHSPYTGLTLLVISECLEHKGGGCNKQWQGDDPRWLSQFPEFVQMQYGIILTKKAGVTEAALKLYGVQISDGTPANQLNLSFVEMKRHRYQTACAKFLSYCERYKAKYKKAQGSGLLQLPRLGAKADAAVFGE